MLGKSIVDSASFTATTTLILITAAVVLAEHSTTAITKNDADVAVETKNRPKSSVFLHERDNFDKYQDLNGEGKHLRDSSYVEHLLADEFEKRASMRGFQGMRGKKSDYNLPHEYQNSEPSFGFESLDYYDKRAPMGFHGMRGKKTEFAATYGDNELDKRAPMGFQGMRGKKSLETVLDELEKRAMLGFQGMRGKKAEEYEEQRQRQLIDSPWHNKRAPSMGFHGMRGKKNEFLDELDQLEKRALLGFHGMRGKKDMYENDDAQLMDFDGYVEKRPMMMGFHGMRGKRSINYYGLTNRVDESSSSRYEKRSPYWYFGTRGKKNPRWEMRGKFVGVRGKKWISAPGQLKPSYYVATNDELEDNEENDDNVLELFDHSDRIAGSTTRH